MPVMAALVSVSPLVAILSVVDRAPVAVGENATATVQVWPWVSTVAAAQVPAGITNCGASAPVRPTSWTVRGSLPVLVSVYVRAAARAGVDLAVVAAEGGGGRQRGGDVGLRRGGQRRARRRAAGAILTVIGFRVGAAPAERAGELLGVPN